MESFPARRYEAKRSRTKICGCIVRYNLEQEVGEHDQRTGPECKRIFLACLDYGKTQDTPQPVICYSWVARRHEAMFGGTFHPSGLHQLERLGVLAKDGDTSRGGGRRYYRIIAPTEPMNIKVEPLKSKPPIDARLFPCPDCGQVLGPVTPAQLQATAWPYHALYSLGHRRALGYESRNG